MNATQVRLLYYLLAGLFLLGLIYQLLPILACQLDLRLAATWRLQRISLRRGWQKILPRPLHQWLSRRLLQAGFRDSDHLGRYLLALALPAPVLALGARLMAGDARNGFLAGLLLAALCNQWVGQRIKQRRNAFHLCLYKIYRFLDLQLTAGIKATDVLKGLSEAVTDPAIKPDFQRFCASFELTLDLDQALQELDSAFHSSDLTLLSSQLRQCLQTGIVGRTFLRMEELMFSRHISLITAQTRQYKTWLLLISLLALGPVVILFVYPLIAQAQQAVQAVFSP